MIGRATVAWVGLLLLTALTCAWLVLSGAGLTGSDTAHPALLGASDGAGTPLRVGYSIEPPYAYLDASGQVQGESPEVLRALLRPLGWPEPVWMHLRFGQLLHELQMGRIDLIASGMFITPPSGSAWRRSVAPPRWSVRPCWWLHSTRKGCTGCRTSSCAGT